MYNWKLGLSIGDLSKKMFDDCAKNGVDVVEVSVNDNVLRELDWNSVKQNAKDSGVGIWSVHLPFWGNPKIDPADMDKSVRDYTVGHFRDLIGRSAELGAKTAVVHPGSRSPTKPEERATRVGYSQESMAKLAEIAAGYGMTAAVEDLPRTCLGNTAAELLEIVSADDRLGVTFDVNHLLEDTHENFMKLLGKRIVTLHISDYDFQNERHWIPGEGGIDWESLMAMRRRTPATQVRGSTSSRCRPPTRSRGRASSQSPTCARTTTCLCPETFPRRSERSTRMFATRTLM